MTTEGKVLVGILGSDTFKQEGSNRLTIDKLIPAVHQLTHLVYGPIDIDFETNKLTISNHHDLDTDTNLGYLNRISGLKQQNPNLTVLVSIGNLDYNYERALKYVALLNNDRARKEFVFTVIEFVQKYNYDGVNLTWEFPRNKKGVLESVVSGVASLLGKEDKTKENFVLFVTDLNQALKDQGKILTITVPPTQENIEDYYMCHALSNQVAFFIICTFDYINPEQSPLKADHSAPLYTPRDRKKSVEASIWEWRGCGLPDAKFVVGIPTFGRSWILGDNMVTFRTVKVESTEAPFNAVKAGHRGRWSKIEGFLTTPEVHERLLNVANSHLTGDDAPLKEVTTNEERYGAYAIKTKVDGGEFISYETPRSTQFKAKYVQDRGLCGVAIFNLEYEDYDAQYYEKPFPILNAAAMQFFG